jgi:predicted Fe-Mo cluster-binding NifX family protein
MCVIASCVIFVYLLNACRVRRRATIKPRGAITMRIAIASGDGRLVDQHFGHATQFLICEPNGTGFRLIDVRRNSPACGAGWTPGAEDPMERSARLVADCQVVLVAQIGECGLERLSELGIEAFELPGPIDRALRQVTAQATPHSTGERIHVATESGPGQH